MSDGANIQFRSILWIDTSKQEPPTVMTAENSYYESWVLASRPKQTAWLEVELHLPVNLCELERMPKVGKTIFGRSRLPIFPFPTTLTYLRCIPQWHVPILRLLPDGRSLLYLTFAFIADLQLLCGFLKNGRSAGWAVAAESWSLTLQFISFLVYF